MRAWGESSALECMWIYAAYELRSRIAAFDGPMIGRPRLFAKRCAILFPSSARSLWHRLACKGTGANGRIWPAMMSAELPEGWA
jgi:hypothetical protein